jgi:hypothetical protein
MGLENQLEDITRTIQLAVAVFRLRFPPPDKVAS